MLLPLSACAAASGASSYSHGGGGVTAVTAVAGWSSWSDMQLQQRGTVEGGLTVQDGLASFPSLLLQAPCNTTCNAGVLTKTSASTATTTMHKTGSATAAVRWQLSDWGGCSAPCGNGTRTRSAACVATQTDTTLAASVCEHELGSLDPLTLTQPCNPYPCAPTLSWLVTPWSHCGGEIPTGYSTRTVTCVKPMPTNTSAETPSFQVVPDAVCLTQINHTKPTTSAACFHQPPAALCVYPGLGENYPLCSGSGVCTMTGEC